jgi:hypothetical protein
MRREFALEDQRAAGKKRHADGAHRRWNDRAARGHRCGRPRAAEAPTKPLIMNSMRIWLKLAALGMPVVLD